MENFETFTGYLNGTLPYPEEQKLFSEMNLDEGLRDQFRRFVSLDSGLKKATYMHIPPAEVTNNIYAGLGFAIPGTSELVKTQAVQIPVKSASHFLNSGLIKMIVTGAGSAVLGVVATLFFINTDSGITNVGELNKSKFERKVVSNAGIISKDIHSDGGESVISKKHYQSHLQQAPSEIETNIESKIAYSKIQDNPLINLPEISFSNLEPQEFIHINKENFDNSFKNKNNPNYSALRILWDKSFP